MFSWKFWRICVSALGTNCWYIINEWLIKSQREGRVERERERRRESGGDREGLKHFQISTQTRLPSSYFLLRSNLCYPLTVRNWYKPQSALLMGWVISYKSAVVFVYDLNTGKGDLCNHGKSRWELSVTNLALSSSTLKPHVPVISDKYVTSHPLSLTTAGQ